METQSRKAHPFLRKALEAIYALRGAEGRPPPPYHLGPPTPQLTARNAVELMLWMVEDAIVQTPADGPACIGVLAAVRAGLDAPGHARLAGDDPRLKRLSDTTRGMRPDRAPILLLFAVDALHSFGSNRQAEVFERVESSIDGRTRGLDAKQARAFVRKLDDEIMRLECAHVVRMLDPRPSEPDRVLWRWGGPAASRAEQWIVRTRTGHAWITAAPRNVPGRGKRTFVEGTLDDALGCVPAEQFASATDIALSREKG